MTAEVTQDTVLERLRKVRGPDRQGNIVDLGLVDGVAVSGAEVTVSVAVPADRAAALEPLRQAVEKVVAGIDGVARATAVLTAASEAKRPAPAAAQAAAVPPPMQAMAGGAAQGEKIAGVPGVKSIIAVASGKGGVGKSTTAVNLALALQARGNRVGMMDADIYGPSLPRMLAVTGRPTARGKVLSPLEAYGMKVMSMGFLVDEDTPMIWRGPMVISALTQMLQDVAWGELDVLVVDMPPGTGDAQLTMAQNVPLAGAVIVSTPQDIALLDARKGLNMFRKVEVPVLGIIENMSFYVCPSCGERSHIFGHGGAREEARRLGAPFLGEVPLNRDIRMNADGGTPEVIAAPDGPHAEVYGSIAAEIEQRLKAEEEMGAAPPRIVVN